MAKSLRSVIDFLNAGRARELTAVQTYLTQHYELDDQGFGSLAKRMKATGIEEMKHAEALADRILFLGGTPVSAPDASVKKGQTIAAMLATDIALEAQAVRLYNEAAAVCAAAPDLVSKALFERLLADEEGHLDRFQNFHDHVARLGASYLSTLTGEGE